ncbi:response regulator [uncultured Amphritea sp.]|uniref:response regulator n=1 Tax=uncultured Amphritea sp. TaxID=981605 RepID=UPI002605FCF3|nr:response regulator [uncultured Amphritea sp.]
MTSTILIIDDSPSNQQKLFTWLRPTGNRLSFARDCHSAMKILLRKQPQLIIFSVKQPHMSAQRLINKLQARAPMAKLIGILSATASSGGANPGSMQQISDVLIEPLCQEEVLITVSQLLRLQRLSMENDYLREELAFSSLAAHWHTTGEYGHEQEIHKITIHKTS